MLIYIFLSCFPDRWLIAISWVNVYAVQGPFTSTAQKPARTLEFFICENSIDLGLPFFGLWDLWPFWVPLLRLSHLRRRPTSDRFQVLLWPASLRAAPGISPFHGDRTARDNALSSRLSAFARAGRDTKPRRCERFVRRASKQPAGQLAPHRLRARQRQRTSYVRASFVPLSPCSPCNLLSNNRSLKTSEQIVESA